MNKFAAERTLVVQAMQKIASANGVPLTPAVAQDIVLRCQDSPIVLMKWAEAIPVVSPILGGYQKVASPSGGLMDLADTVPAPASMAVDPFPHSSWLDAVRSGVTQNVDALRSGLVQNATLSPWATGLGAAGAGALGAALPYMVAPGVFNRKSPWYYHLAPAALGAGGALAGAMYTPDIVNSISGLLS